jgi:glyoxylase-like metal-dependent hydrolase (beta-lactamase superfamily II)
MEIVTGIHQVDGVNGNCYILVRNGLTVIDTGLPAGSGKKILSYIRNTMFREPAEINTIIITHFHMDHIGGVSALKQAAPGAKIAIGAADAGYVSGQYPLPVYPGFRGFLLRIAGAIMNPGIFPADILLNDGDRIDGLVCIHIPGHTPGSIGLYDERTQTFFCGDILRYNGTSLTEGPALFTTDMPGSHQSIRKIASLDFEILLPGHGVPLRNGAAGKVREFAATLPAET